jgi:16S rRNA (guanine527-N7)-methyltransferase
MPLNAIEQKKLISWLEQKKIPPGEVIFDKISKYHDLILSWSKRINLVSKQDQGKLLENHILDSLGPIEMIPSTGNLIDIGSGAGLPGIPLAIVYPSLNVTLLESIHKKVLFLRVTIDQLGLDNIRIFEGRLEGLNEFEYYDIATIRALPKWESHLERIKSLIKPDGKIIYYEYRSVYNQIKR